MRAVVRETEDFARIRALPRRRLSQADADAWAKVLTPELALPGRGGALRPWQALSIAEALEQRGAWLALPVGLGKTLISWLLCVAFEARRPILILPANLREKTYADFANYLGVWRSANPSPRLVSREELALDQNRLLLDQLRPDLIVIDEADDLANRDSAACRRIDRYRVAHDRSELVIVPMTGTPGRKSIMNYLHLLVWALLEDAPVPLSESEALTWAGAIDEEGRFAARRSAPGALGNTVAEARRWYQQRLAETPGVVIVDGDSAGKVPLTIRVRLAGECPEIDAHYERFAVQQENPAGIPVSDPLSRWRTDGQLGCGLYLRYVAPGPPPEWLAARKALAKFTRTAIDESQRTARPIDTEAQAIARHRTHPIVAAWLAVRAHYTPETEAVWLSDTTLRTAEAWLRESAAPGVVWCGGVEFGVELARRTGLSYYGAEGRDQTGRGLHAADPRQNLIASWNANKKGFNLQLWRRAALFQPPQSAKWLEQVYGRHHRTGADLPVTIDMFATSGGTLDGFEAAIREAGFAKQTIGLTQKILRAKIETAPMHPTTGTNMFRWAQRDG